MKKVEIGNKWVGKEEPVFIIAEAGVNHNGEILLAKKLIDVAVEAKADAVKFQTFHADRLAIPDAPKAEYQLQTSESSETQFEMLKRLELFGEDHRQLLKYCKEKKILFLSTPFDEESADFLDDLGLPAFKIPSGEVINLPFLEHVACFKKPIILSTGMAFLEEVKAGVEAIRKMGNNEIVLLHCVSNYPANPAHANLRAMKTMEETFDLPVGFSDHTMGIEVSLAATALGACLIEKHFTLDRSLPGPDHKASLVPHELEALVRGIRTVEESLGHGRKEPAPGESKTSAATRKSLVAARDIPAGTVLTEEMIAIKRPGMGLPPAMRQNLVGQMVRKDVPAGAVFTLELLG